MALTEHITHFQTALRDWTPEPERDEAYFRHVRDGTLSSLDPGQAFEAIDEAVALLIEQEDDTLRYQCGLLVFALARQTSTTELPRRLDHDWNRVIAAIEHDEWLTSELHRWYRRPGRGWERFTWRTGC